MWKQTAAAFVLAMFAQAAFAFSCPALMAEIDEALADDSIAGELSEVDLQMVQELRELGETLHDRGDHDESEDALNEARSILGIDNGGGGSGYY